MVSSLYSTCFALVACTALVNSNPLDDFVSKPESVYKYVDTLYTGKTLLGGTVHVLNVTSLAWLDTSIGAGPSGTNIWNHLVAVVIPKELRVYNYSLAYLTGNSNNDHSPPKATDEELIAVDLVTHNTGACGIIVYQIPNCPYIFKADPTQMARGEDNFIAWTWKMYLEDDGKHPEYLARFPMVKGAFQSMRAAQDFLNKKVEKSAIDNWIVSGASKRGWTTWMVGATTCTGENCVNIAGLAPLVPIVPNIRDDMHRQWMSYNGWTFAFSPYTALNLTQYVDSDSFKSMTKHVDPMHHGERLARLPKFVVVSSDDEFMQMDWTNIWYDEFQKFGETHLLIVQDSEHSLATGVPEVVSSLSAALESVAANVTRPTFDYSYNNKTGELEVTIPDEFAAQVDQVRLFHTQTHSAERRDFRWVRHASNESTLCKFPGVALAKPVFGGGNCVELMVWSKDTLDAVGSNTYKASPPQPKEGHYTGYYIEVSYKSALKADYLFSTPGFVWPNTLPFPDCHGKECNGKLL